MIRIRIKGDESRIEGFLIWGHAGFAPKGEDVVCAGVSAVATAALMGLLDRLPGLVRYRILSQGLIVCRLPRGLPPDPAAAAQLILKTMILGLEGIRRRHPDSIDFAYRR